MSIEDIGETKKARPQKKESRRAKRDSQEASTTDTKRNGKKTPALAVVRGLAPNERAVVTVIESVAPDRLAKLYRLGPDGSLVKESAGEMIVGVATIASAANVTALAALIGRLAPNQALTYGMPFGVPPHHESDPAGDHDPLGSWDVGTKSEVERARARDPDGTRSLVSRTRDRFAWANGPGVFMIDYDVDQGEETLGRDALYAAIISAAPWLSDVQMLHVPSSSSHIYNVETGDEIQGLRGQRLYFCVSDASKIPDIGTALVNALWAHSLGRIVLSRGPGRMLERTLVDASVWQPERLDFAAGAVCQSPLEQRHRVPTVIGGEAEVFDVSLLDSLSDALASNANAANAAREAAKAAKKPESTARASAWADARTDERLAPEPDATPARRKAVREQYLRAVTGTSLEPDFVLHVCDEGGSNPSPVAVREILDDPKRYVGRLTLDPLEPDYDGSRVVGKLFIGDDDRIRLHSFAHGTSTHELIDLRPEVKRPGYFTHWGYTTYGRPGLYLHLKPDPKKPDDDPQNIWISPPIECVARTVGAGGKNSGRALRWRNGINGEEHVATVRLSDLQSHEGINRTLSNLADAGFEGISGESRRDFLKWVNSDIAHAKVRVATALGGYGWQRGSDGRRVFVTTTGAIIGDDDGEFFLQTEAGSSLKLPSSGTLEGWRSGVGALCVGNPLFIVAVSTALAGALLDFIDGLTGIGLHIYGDNGRGKSTAVAAAASVWGKPNGGMIAKWNGTTSGFQARATALSGMLFALDEIGQAKAEDVGTVAYSIIDGEVRTRADQRGGAQARETWSVALLSTGEHTLASYMATSSKRGPGAMGGQEARLLSINAMRTHGCFDELHGYDAGDLSLEIDRATAAEHGVVGREFVKRLLASGKTDDELREVWTALRGVLESAPDVTDFERRASKTFALIALASTLAREFDLVPWSEDQGLDAVQDLYDKWRGEHGGSPEDAKVKDGIRDFCERYGTSRFEDKRATDPDARPPNDRAGWREDLSGEGGRLGRIYYFTKGALAEAVPGMPPNRIAKALDDADWIYDRDKGGRRTYKLRVGGETHNVYAVRPSA